MDGKVPKCFVPMCCEACKINAPKATRKATFYETESVNNSHNQKNKSINY